MKTINHNITNEIIIRKSRFITNLIKVENVDDAKLKLDTIKNKYNDATHNCYAYIVDNYKKASDDREPSGTAGLPMLNILESNNLTNILCVVTRYFGGIKLGAGGLVRAYASSVTSTLNKADIRDIKKAILITIKFKYDDIKNIDFILKDCTIINKIFDIYITYQVLIEYALYQEVKSKLEKLITSLKEEKTMFI